jgi:hypothetical protein
MIEFPKDIGTILKIASSAGGAELIAEMMKGTPAQRQAIIDSWKLDPKQIINKEEGIAYGLLVGQEMGKAYGSAGWTKVGMGAAEKLMAGWGVPAVPVNVVPKQLTEAWQAIVDFFAGKKIYIDTNLGGYGGVTGYAAGGPIPGPANVPVPIIAHGGEYMLNRQDVAEIKTALMSGNSSPEVVSAIRWLGNILTGMPNDYALGQLAKVGVR